MVNGPRDSSLPSCHLILLMCNRPMSSFASANVTAEEEELREASSRLLENALTQILCRLQDDKEVNDYMDAHSFSFANYSHDGEHMLEWTRIHCTFCQLVEKAIAAELQVLGCSEDAMLEHAMWSEQGGRGDQLLRRLLSKTSYEDFCEMMHEEACSVLRAATLGNEDDDDDEYGEVVEESGGAEDDEDEGLEQAMATVRLQEEVAAAAQPHRRW